MARISLSHQATLGFTPMTTMAAFKTGENFLSNTAQEDCCNNKYKSQAGVILETSCVHKIFPIKMLSHSMTQHPASQISLFHFPRV